MPFNLAGFGTCFIAINTCTLLQTFFLVGVQCKSLLMHYSLSGYISINCLVKLTIWSGSEGLGSKWPATPCESYFTWTEIETRKYSYPQNQLVARYYLIWEKCQWICKISIEFMVCKILSQLIWLKVTFDTDTRQKNLNSTASKYETFTVQICCGNCTTYSQSSNYFIQIKCC